MNARQSNLLINREPSYVWTTEEAAEAMQAK